jgi:hypothetical protein
MTEVQQLHPFKSCDKCEQKKPPEGGITMGQKWICQACWIIRTTGRYLRQNRKNDA